MTVSPTRQLVAGVVESGLSDDAVHAAARIARAFNADLEVVHAVSVPPILWPGVTREELARIHSLAVTASEDRLRPHLEEVERRFELARGELSESLLCLPGDPARVLLERQEEAGADALFLGMHEKRRTFDFGRTVRTLLHRARRPVWLQPGPWREIESILAPVDFSAHSRASLDSAVTLARGLGAEVRVVHAFVPPHLAYPEDVARAAGWPREPEVFFREQAQEDLEAFVAATAWHDVRHRQEFVDGLPEEAILERAGDAQLVVMGSRGHTGLLGPLLGHVTYDIMKQSPAPVLALRS